MLCIEKLKVRPWVRKILADVAINAIDMMVNEGDWDPEYRPIFWVDIGMTFTYHGLMGSRN